MVRLESVLIAILGTLSGVALGLIGGATTIWSLNRLSESEISLNLALGRLAIVIVIGVLLGIAASLWPARRSARLEVLDAIQSA